MLGAIIGDIAGSVYEFNNIKSEDFPLLEDRCFFTDDSVMTKEGLYIGAGLDRMVDLYGNDFEHSQGMYVYQKGSTKLIVGVAAEDVVSLEYAGTYGK